MGVQNILLDGLRDPEIKEAAGESAVIY